MRKGDTLYFRELLPRMDKALVAAAYREGYRIETACFVATNLDPTLAHRVVRVTMVKPVKLREKQ
jgi:hypothetical protein